jgi:K+:H+ antiporter
MTSATLFLLQAFIIVLAPAILAYLFRLNSYLPVAVIQILAGIALGPSVLGSVSPTAYRWLFGPDSLQPLLHVASIALLLFGFAAGMHLDLSRLRGLGRAVSAISAASLLVPAGLGLLAGIWILRIHADAAGPTARGLEFPLGLAICTAVTALPVMAAILRDTGLARLRIGQIALAVAAVNDAALWVMLSALLALKGILREPGAMPLAVLAALLLYWTALPLSFNIAIKVSRQLTAAGEEQRVRLQLVLACSLALGSAILSEWSGLHYVLGAFVAGTAVPRGLRNTLLERIEPLTIAILMPFFFMSMGLKTSIDTRSPIFMSVFAAVTAAALLGKLGGVSAAARLAGESWRDSLALGALTQTKGLMEVVVVTTLLDAGIFSQDVFSAVILMAVLSTCITMPLTRVILGAQPLMTEALSCKT